jgi:hypothetical protein
MSNFKRLETRAELEEFLNKREDLKNRRKALLANVQKELDEIDSDIRKSDNFLEASILSYCDPYGYYQINVMCEPHDGKIYLEYTDCRDNHYDSMTFPVENLYGLTKGQQEEIARKEKAAEEARKKEEKRVARDAVLSKLSDEDRRALGFK